MLFNGIERKRARLSRSPAIEVHIPPKQPEDATMPQHLRKIGRFPGPGDRTRNCFQVLPGQRKPTVIATTKNNALWIALPSRAYTRVGS
jgi:hypothetical protein